MSFANGDAVVFVQSRGKVFDGQCVLLVLDELSILVLLHLVRCLRRRGSRFAMLKCIVSNVRDELLRCD